MEQGTNIGGGLPIGARTAIATMLVRGVLRLFRSLDCAALPEIVLGNGRRADVLAIDRRGTLTIVEVKSSVEDFRQDRKWPEYMEFCDCFSFAVGPDFPMCMLPDDVGIIVSDGHGAAVVRTPQPRSGLPPARRRAITLSFARAAASRLAVIADPHDPAHTLGRRAI